MGGVTLRRLSDRIARSKAYAIGVRKLVKLDGNIVDTELNRKLWKLAINRVDKSYNTSSIDMLTGLLQSYTSHSNLSTRNRYHENILSLSMSVLRTELGTSTPALPRQSFLARALLTLRLKQLQEETSRLQSTVGTSTIPAQHSEEADAHPAASKYFCSPLVAEVMAHSL